METKPCSLPTLDIHVDDLVPRPDNVNEMSDKMIESLSDEIRDKGFLDPLNVIPMSDGKYLILGGEHRWLAGKLAGMTFIPCVVQTDEKWQDKDIVDLTAFNLNSIHGRINQNKFVDMYRRLSSKLGPDKVQKSMVLTEDARKYLKGIESQMRAAGASPEQIDDMRKKAARAKSPKDLSSMLSKFFKDQTAQIASNSIVVHYETSEYVVIKANLETYISMRKLVELSSGRDINEYLGPALRELAMKIEKEKGSSPPC